MAVKQTSPSKLFTDIINQGERLGYHSNQKYEKQSVKWYREQAKKATTSPAEIMRDSGERFRQSVVPGRLYFFYYDPKYKKELPYYDRFPLVFPIDFQSDYFLGLNMHYLDGRNRALLMDALLRLTNNNKMDHTTKLQVSYDILKNAARYKYFKPTIKKYLKSHVRSRFVQVNANEWQYALWLPVAQFEKAPQSKVWADSRRKIFG